MAKQSEDQKANLLTVKRIGEIMVDNKKISAEQNNEISQAVTPGKFYGTTGVNEGVIKESNDLYNALITQSILRSAAALKDAQLIAAGTKLDFGYLIPHWGNNGVPNAINTEEPAIVSAMSAAANVAALLVVLAKDNPDIIKKSMDGIIAATQIVAAIKDDIVASDELLPILKQTLFFVANDKEILPSVAKQLKLSEEEASKIIGTYTENRFAEIASGLKIAQSKEAPQVQAISTPSYLEAILKQQVDGGQKQGTGRSL